jgi:NTE family protein
MTFDLSDTSGEATTTSAEPAEAPRPRRRAKTLSTRRPRWRDYTAFVLSGGGARGALQVGALRALIEHGERPDLIIGTSVGAWNGAWLALGASPERMETMTRVWASVHPAQVLLGRERVAGGASRQAIRGALALAAARNVTRDSPALYSDIGLRQLLRRYYAGATFEALAVPLYVIATNLTAGQRTVFSSGEVGPALLASSAIPGIFPPVRIGDALYVDGGAVENCGVELALTLGARRIFVLDVGYDASHVATEMWSAPISSDTQTPAGRRRTRTMAPHALASVLDRTTQVMGRYQLERDLARLPAGVEAHVIRPTPSQGGGALDFDAAPEWIDRGYAFTRAYLASLPAESRGRRMRENMEHA